MHELAIATSLVEQIEKVAREQRAVSVSRLTVAVGRLSGVDPEALQSAFPLAAEDSLAAGAGLDIEVVEARVRCRMCGRDSTPEAPFLYCAHCQSTEVEMEAGRELDIKTMEINCEMEKEDGTECGARPHRKGSDV
jgi:hydrogenase nickel incorporation protein HypA/HybF